MCNIQVDVFSERISSLKNQMTLKTHGKNWGYDLNYLKDLTSPPQKKLNKKTRMRQEDKK